MPDFTFEWDPRKAAANLAKHGVGFPEASTAFDDRAGILLNDLVHSQDEPRILLLGLSTDGRLLVVVHCLRQAGHSIRLISARRASAREHRTYLEGSRG